MALQIDEAARGVVVFQEKRSSLMAVPNALTMMFCCWAESDCRKVLFPSPMDVRSSVHRDQDRAWLACVLP